MAGINIIRRWVMSQMTKKSDDGIMITLPDMKKVELNTNITIERFLKNGINPDAFTNTQQVDNVINQLNRPKVITQDDPLFKGVMSRMMGKNVIKKDFGKPFKEEIAKMESEATNPRFLDYTIDSMKKMEPIDAMKEANKVIKREGPYKNLSSKEAKKILDDTEDHIFERNFKTPDDPDFDPESMADGGRIGLKEGDHVNTNLDYRPEDVNEKLTAYYSRPMPSPKTPTKDITSTGITSTNPTLFSRFAGSIFNFNNIKDEEETENLATGGRIGYKKGSVDLARRGFMKAAAGVGAGIGALKMGALKLFGKEGAKQVTKNIIKTDNVPGKPEWFDALVTKVINEGEDVTKRFATQERELVHKLDIDKFEDVTVYRNMDTGEIRVSYESPTNVGEQSVDLVYKKPLPDEGDPRPSAEFYAVEPEPRVVNRDGDMEMDGENLVNSVDDLMSDTSKLKIIAKGDAKPTLKEFVTSKRKKDAAKKLNEDPMEQVEYIENKYGPAPADVLDDLGPDDFASGGIARMLGE